MTQCIRWLREHELGGRMPRERPNAQVHKLHPAKVSRAGWPRPVCCSVSVEPDSGEGVAEAHLLTGGGAQWCDRCAHDLAVQLNN